MSLIVLLNNSGNMQLHAFSKNQYPVSPKCLSANSETDPENKIPESKTNINL